MTAVLPYPMNVDLLREFSINNGSSEELVFYVEASLQNDVMSTTMPGVFLQMLVAKVVDFYEFPFLDGSFKVVDVREDGDTLVFEVKLIPDWNSYDEIMAD